MIGLPFAHRETKQDIVFLWADEKQKGMIGLWGASTGYGRLNEVIAPCHLAFAVTMDQLQCAIGELNERGIETRWFGGN